MEQKSHFNDSRKRSGSVQFANDQHGWFTQNVISGAAKGIFFALMLLAGIPLSAQNYNMSNTAVTTCSGNFYDSGGAGLSGSGRYQVNENFTKTFYPSVAGNKVKITFTTFSTEEDYDSLSIYDGNSTSAPLISSGAPVGDDPVTCPAGAYSGTNSPGTVTSTAADGSLTFVFRSDSFVRAGGWIASISCEAPATTAPDCASGLSPANAASGVARNGSLSWSAAAGATSYDVYFGTSATPAFVTNQTGLSYDPGALSATTQYYWKIVPKNDIGDAVGCSTQSFTTGANFDYCSSIVFSQDVEPITSVDFAGIANTSSATVNGTPSLQDFTAISGNVFKGATYVMTIKGNTAGAYTNNFRVFIDWNQDGDFADPGEAFNAGSINSSTGVDTKQAVSNIEIPSDALEGSTRMRIKKLYSSDSGNVDDPCTGGQYGQVEDYTLNVMENNQPDMECVTLNTPADGATGVPFPSGNVTFSWTPSGTGPVATAYDLYIGTSADNLSFIGTTSMSTEPVGGFQPGTEYFWSVVAKAEGANDATGCEVFSFTTENPFLPYCYSGVNYTTDIEPITSVNFAGIANTSSAVVNGSPSLENFTDQIANLTAGDAYAMAIKGNTAGNFTNYFRIFIDWNQDGDFDDANESIGGGSIVNSNGTDAVVANSTVNVPADALAGTTRMRIKKLYSSSVPSSWDACSGGSYGQSEDYSVTVCIPSIWYADADGDGYGVDGDTVSACDQPDGYAAVGGDCDDTLFAVNPGHAEVLYNGVDDNCDGQLDEGNQLTTSLLPSSCGTTLTSIGSLVGITTVSSAITGYRIKITNGAEVQIIEKAVPHFTFPEFPSYSYAATYSVEIEMQRYGVWLGYYGAPCLVSTPAILEEGGASSVSPSQCGIVLPKINTLIATTSIQGVTGYRFQITNLTDPLGPNAVQTIDRTQNWFSLPMLARYNYGTLYRIEIAVKTTGAFGGFGAPCEVSSPAAPSLINCGGIAASGTATVAATSVQGATQYRFQITRQSDLASATIDRNSNYFIFNSVPASAFTPGALYSIRVAVMTTGNWSPFGDACEYTAPGGSAKGASADAVAVNATFKATAYPNPFATDFNVDVVSDQQNEISIQTYDMLGRLIESKTAQPGNLSRLGAGYPSGVYNVIVTQGETVKTLRVIKR